MEPHVHITPVHILATLAAMVAIMGTIHLLALSSDSRWGRGVMALGF